MHESTSPSTILGTALRLADRRGWAFFPVRGKAPATGHWPSDSTSDPKELVAMFAGTGYGLGLDCGKSGVVVLDADRPQEVPLGLHLGDAWAWHGKPWRRSFLFDRPEGLDVGCPRWAAGEVKGRGGYVVLPPSRHPLGFDYAWVSTSGSRVMPEDVRALLMPRRMQGEGIGALTGGDPCALVRRKVAEKVAELHAATPEGKHDVMRGARYWLCCRSAEGHPGVERAMLALRAAYYPVLTVDLQRRFKGQLLSTMREARPNDGPWCWDAACPLGPTRARNPKAKTSSIL